MFFFVDIELLVSLLIIIFIYNKDVILIKTIKIGVTYKLQPQLLIPKRGA